MGKGTLSVPYSGVIWGKWMINVHSAINRYIILTGKYTMASVGFHQSCVAHN